MRGHDTFIRMLPVAAGCLVLLAGCSTLLDPDANEPPGILKASGARPSMFLSGSGVQQFQCTADEKGRYWKFITPWADLRDSSGKIVVTQGRNFVFSSPDGSKLKAEIIESSPGRTGSDLPVVIFATTSFGKEGLLTGIRFVKRENASGGIPRTACSASQTGQTLNVRFSASFSFYR